MIGEGFSEGARRSKMLGSSAVSVLGILIYYWRERGWDYFLIHGTGVNCDYPRLGKYFLFCAERRRLLEYIFLPSELGFGLYTFENMAVNS